MEHERTPTKCGKCGARLRWTDLSLSAPGAGLTVEVECTVCRWASWVYFLGPEFARPEAPDGSALQGGDGPFAALGQGESGETDS